MKKTKKPVKKAPAKKLKITLPVLVLVTIVTAFLAYHWSSDKSGGSVSPSSAARSESSGSLQQILQAQRTSSINLIYASQTLKVPPQAMSDWYKPAGKKFELSDSLIQQYISQTGTNLGIKVSNLNQATFQVKNAVNLGKSADVVLNAEGVTKTFTYCAQLRGVSNTYLPNFIQTLEQIYSDPRGWSLGGQVVFKLASQGCNFYIWLSAADQMPSFGGLCDSDWSCRAGDNVVINFNRWRYSSTAWLSSGNNLHDYRALAVNHETGHWFGFMHSGCPAAGTAAPVMMQQSVDLQGCRFNWWPLESERNILRSQLGL